MILYPYLSLEIMQAIHEKTMRDTRELSMSKESVLYSKSKGFTICKDFSYFFLKDLIFQYMISI